MLIIITLMVELLQVRTAIYPGTFDPITNGHVDVAKRASRIADQVIIAVAEVSNKKPLFSQNERISLAQNALKDSKNIQVVGFNTLLIDFIKQWEAPFVIRGLRAASDFDYEYQMVNMTRQLSPEVNFVFLMASQNNACISSTLIKEITALGGDISAFVHPHVHQIVTKKLQRKKKAHHHGINDSR